MSTGVSRLLVVTAALVWLSGCESFTKTGLWQSDSAPTSGTQASAGPTADPAATGSIPSVTGSGPAQTGAEVLADNPNDDVLLGKRHFLATNYGLAEQYYRRAIEKGPRTAHRDAEAWIGLAASYDQLKRFDLADRAYAQAIKLVGPTPEILNNQGYSYILRGDYAHARKKLMLALNKDPTNPFIRNNIKLLDKSGPQPR